MDMLNLALRYLHIVGAMVLVGGVFYLRFAVTPMLAELDEPQREAVAASLRRKWIMFVMLSIALLLATGITNMVLIPKQNDFAEGPSYSMLAGIKFLLAMPVFFIVSTLLGRSANAEKFRQKSALWLNVALVLCLAIVLLGGYLRFVKRTPKTAANRSKTAEIFRPAA